MTDFFSDSALNNLTQHLLPGLWPFVFALIVSAVAVPFAAVLSRRFGVVAQPGGRHAHTKPTPLLGGFAMWLGFAIAVFVFAAHNLQTLGLLLVSGLATGLLIIDDRWSMRPLVKLAVQLGLALLAVLVFNFQIGYIGLPGGHILEFALPIDHFDFLIELFFEGLGFLVQLSFKTFDSLVQEFNFLLKALKSIRRLVRQQLAAGPVNTQNSSGDYTLDRSFELVS